MRPARHSVTHVRLAAAMVGIACFAAGDAAASTVSFTFSQGGWSDAAGDTGTLTGTFTRESCAALSLRVRARAQ
jgi:hypothetical protein